MYAEDTLQHGADPVEAARGRGRAHAGSGKGTEVAILAAGCFWGVEEILRAIDGVRDTEVGYAGGSFADPAYEDAVTGRTGHAEAVKVIFDPERISYEQVLDYFFRLHDPTTKNRQGNDRGTQYRSAIFYRGQEQRETALTVRERVDGSCKWPVPEVVAAGPFYPADPYPRDYLQKNAGGYHCHILRD